MPDTVPDDTAVEALAEAIWRAMHYRGGGNYSDYHRCIARDLLSEGYRRVPAGSRVVSEGPSEALKAEARAGRLPSFMLVGTVPDLSPEQMEAAMDWLMTALVNAEGIVDPLIGGSFASGGVEVEVEFLFDPTRPVEPQP